jgi:hypothetical protein
MTPPDPPRSNADEILAKVDRLLKRDQVAAPTSDDVPMLSEVLVPGTHTRPMHVSGPMLDPGFEARVVQAILRDWLPTIEARIADDVRRRLVTEMSQALSIAVVSALADVRADVRQTLEAAVNKAVSDALKK